MCVCVLSCWWSEMIYIILIPIQKRRFEMLFTIQPRHFEIMFFFFAGRHEENNRTYIPHTLTHIEIRIFHFHIYLAYSCLFRLNYIMILLYITILTYCYFPLRISGSTPASTSGLMNLHQTGFGRPWETWGAQRPHRV